MKETGKENEEKILGIVLNIADERAMHVLGGRIAEYLFSGAFVALFGDLGAGKTTLTQGIANALGIEEVSSPTFTIVRHYSGKGFDLDHFDAYRLSDSDELLAIGFEDYLASGSVIVMEWCENVIDALPNERLEIHILGSGSDVRTVELLAFGSKYLGMLESIKKS